MTVAVSAQQHSIDWHKISGGDGTSAGSNYSISGTIGQPDATLQPTISGNYSLTGGFWILSSVVQTAGAQKLYISHLEHTATVYWQNVSGWNLYQNSNLSSPSAWSLNGSATLSSGRII